MREAPIFITARFRSGSTLLWNIFKHLPNTTAYYEPLHPILRTPDRIRDIDPTHNFVTNYWEEYERIPQLDQWYVGQWHYEDLYLDESHDRPELSKYINKLIEAAQGRAVLQFNRIDFRLAWIRHVFPQARLIHLYRHPRDQWMSTLRGPFVFGPNDLACNFGIHDHFFLLPWVDCLKSHFPILDWGTIEHPYCMFYILWKLSYIWGQAHSELSIAYEDLLTNPQDTISNMFKLLDIDQTHVDKVKHLVLPKQIAKWHTYADDAWFTNQEQLAEDALNSIGYGQLL